MLIRLNLNTFSQFFFFFFFSFSIPCIIFAILFSSLPHSVFTQIRGHIRSRLFSAPPHFVQFVPFTVTARKTSGLSTLTRRSPSNKTRIGSCLRKKTTDSGPTPCPRLNEALTTPSELPCTRFGTSRKGRAWDSSKFSLAPLSSAQLSSAQRSEDSGI